MKDFGTVVEDGRVDCDSGDSVILLFTEENKDGLNLVVPEEMAVMNAKEVEALHEYLGFWLTKGRYSGQQARSCDTCEHGEPKDGQWRDCKDCPLPDLPKWERRHIDG